MVKQTSNKPHIVAIKHKKAPAFRSGLERALATQIRQAGLQYDFETIWLKYVQPETLRGYKPDFILENGIIIEGKGEYNSDDRKKMILVKTQFPQLDIRFVFGYAYGKIYKGSKTTKAKWAQDHGFPWADKKIPIEWFKEPIKEVNNLYGYNLLG